MYDPKPNLGIAPLDRLLGVICAPAQIAARPPWSSSPNPDEAEESFELEDSAVRFSTSLPERGQRWKPVVIELTSELPASGKTNFLYFAIALAVLPDNYGGKGATGVWLDLDGRFSARRLREIMCGVVSGSVPDEDEKSSVVLEALRHVHVFRPQSSRQLIATLDSLPSYLLRPGAHSSMSRRLSLLVLDPATAFYWQDRHELETTRLEQPDKIGDIPSRITEIITRLKMMQRDFDCAIAFSTRSAFPKTTRPGPAVRVESIAPAEPRSVIPWTAFATITLSLSRVKVPQFGSGMTLEDCLRDRSQRQEAVAEGKFLAEIDGSGAERWASNVKDMIRRMNAEGNFTFYIGTTVQF